MEEDQVLQCFNDAITEPNEEKRRDLLIRACKEITDRIPDQSKFESLLCQPSLFTYLLLSEPLLPRSLSPLLSTLVPFFRLNGSVFGHIISACCSIASLDSPPSLSSKPLVGEILRQKEALQRKALAYLRVGMEAIIKENSVTNNTDCNISVHLPALIDMINLFLYSSNDKSLMLDLLEISQLFKSTIKDQFFIGKFDEYLDQTLYKKYAETELVPEGSSFGATASVLLRTIDAKKRLMRSVSKKFNNFKERESDNVNGATRNNIDNSYNGMVASLGESFFVNSGSKNDLLLAPKTNIQSLEEILTEESVPHFSTYLGLDHLIKTDHSHIENLINYILDPMSVPISHQVRLNHVVGEKV